MTPGARADLGLLVGKLGGVQAHLEEQRIRLLSLSRTLDDVAAGLVWVRDLGERPALTLAVHIEAEAEHLRHAIGGVRIAVALAMGLRL